MEGPTLMYATLGFLALPVVARLYRSALAVSSPARSLAVTRMAPGRSTAGLPFSCGPGISKCASQALAYRDRQPAQ